MLTEDDIITDLARLRERSAGIEYGGEIPMTKRSAAATIAPVAALAVAATVGAGVVAGTRGDDGGPGADRRDAASASETLANPGTTDATGAGKDRVKMVDAEITLAGKTIAYRHAVGEDPFAPGWQLAIEYGASLPANATKFIVTDGSVLWVADAPASESGNSVLIVRSGPDGNTGATVYVGMPSDFSRDALENWVRNTLHGQ